MEEHLQKRREAYDFFSAISSNWWYAKIPPDKREKENIKPNYFLKKSVSTITDDILIAYAARCEREDEHSLSEVANHIWSHRSNSIRMAVMV